MRITTQMLNETARKTGISVNSSSLLDYVNKKDNSSLLDSLQNSMAQKADLAKKKSYEKLDETASSLDEAAKTLASDKEDNLFAKAKESGSTEDVIKAIKSLIEKYNETRKQLDNNASTINTYYNQMLKSLASKNSEELSKLGISVGKDGRITVDEEQLKDAKLEDLEAMFGAESEFVQKLQYLASHVSDSVTAELESMGNQYGQNAKSFSSYINNKYDLWS
ncbi:MAG: hypothetical protein K2N90_05430 [Lachnospiraceae bacterium]|nr:hypothetical protein [Lachnospiraceae bacterium]